MIVVDASLAVKWLIWERDSHEALRFLSVEGRNIAAPELIFVEVAAAIVRRANEVKAVQSDALRALDKWTANWTRPLVRAYRVTPRRIGISSRLAVDLGHPLKDCIYLALANELDCDLATCDARFADKAASHGHRVRMLSDYS